MKVLGLATFAAGAVWLISLQAASAERVALVIGNSDYLQVPRLENPYNDATDIAASLTSIGFDVELVKNQDANQMRRTLEEFGRRALGAEISVIYYAGHGIEVDRENYLIPVDAKLQTDRAVRFEAISLDDMVFASEGASSLSVVIVDACRDNPFRNQMTRSESTRSLGRGLALFEPSPNSIVAYAARSGSVAFDGDGRNSPYAEALLDALAKPGLEVGLMFRVIRDRVLESTDQQQEPWMYGTLSQEQVFLNPATLVDELSPPDPINREIAAWRRVRDSDDIGALEAFLDSFPDGDFAPLVRARIETLRRELAEPEPEVDLAVVLSRAEAQRLQARLSILGYALGSADGVVGPNTRRAIRAYQQEIGLPETGAATEMLIRSIREKVTEARVDALLEQEAGERARRAQVTPRRVTKPTTPSTPTPVQEKEPEPGGFLDFFHHDVGKAPLAGGGGSGGGSDGGGSSGGGGSW